MNIKYFLIIAVLATAILVSGGKANAQAVNCMSYASTGDKITCLTNLIAQLTQQIAQIQAQQAQTTTWCHTFTTNLGYANSGTSEVLQLHTALQKENISYSPDGDNVYAIGTYYAIIQFQAKYRITQTGGVGPITMAKLNSLYGCKPTPTPTPPPIACTPNWTCGWGTCSSGYQSQVPIDSNNCGLSSSDANIACTALARMCTAPISTQPYVSVSTPNGGETFTAGKSVSIFWQTFNLNPQLGDPIIVQLFNKDTGYYNYDISDTTIGSANCPTTTPSYPRPLGSCGTYNWSVPADIAPGSYKIFVHYSARGVAAVDSSDNWFNIIAPAETSEGKPFITVDYPKGGEQLIQGHTYEIKWTISNTDWLSKNGYDARAGLSDIILTNYSNGLKYTIADQVLSTNASLTGGSYSWTVPSQATPSGSFTPSPLVSGDNYKISVSFYPQAGTCWGKDPCEGRQGCYTPPQYYCFAAVNDLSDNYFSIVSATVSTEAAIKVMSPNGGEQWAQGSTHDITWLSTNLQNAGITIVSYANSDSTKLTLSTPALSGFYHWTIPVDMKIGSYKAYVYGVGDALLGEPNDSSDSVFSIVSSTAATCAGFTYSDWGSCSASLGTQTRTITSSLPSGCSGGTSEALSRSCNYFNTCTYFNYTSWSTCYSSGIQTRSVTNSVPLGCTGGGPVLSQTCTYTPPTPAPTGFNVTFPTAGATLTPGQTYQITWTGSLASSGYMALMLFNPSTQSLTTLGGPSATSNSFTWTVPANITPGNYDILFNTTATDRVASSVFTIAALPPVITFPSAGATLHKGQTYNITWQGTLFTSNFPYARMLLVDASKLSPSGDPYSTQISYYSVAIGIATLTNGSFSWTVPATFANSFDPTPGPNYFIVFYACSFSNCSSTMAGTTPTVISPTFSITAISTTAIDLQSTLASISDAIAKIAEEIREMFGQ